MPAESDEQGYASQSRREDYRLSLLDIMRILYSLEGEHVRLNFISTCINKLSEVPH